MQGYGHGGVLAGLDGLAVRVKQRARALRGRRGLTDRDRGGDRLTAICGHGRPLSVTLELGGGVVRQELRRLLLLLGVLEDVVHGARQLARHPHKGRALLLEELEPPDDLEVGRGGALHRPERGHLRRDLQQRLLNRLRNL